MAGSLFREWKWGMEWGLLALRPQDDRKLKKRTMASEERFYRVSQRNRIDDIYIFSICVQNVQCTKKGVIHFG